MVFHPQQGGAAQGQALRSQGRGCKVAGAAALSPQSTSLTCSSLYPWHPGWERVDAHHLLKGSHLIRSQT